MSTLKVNNIDTQTGSNIVVASGKVLSASVHIIQTVIGDQSGPRKHHHLALLMQMLFH